MNKILKMYPSDMQLYQVFGRHPLHTLFCSIWESILPTPILSEHDQGPNFWFNRDHFKQRFIFLQFTLYF